MSNVSIWVKLNFLQYLSIIFADTLGILIKSSFFKKEYYVCRRNLKSLWRYSDEEGFSLVRFVVIFEGFLV